MLLSATKGAVAITASVDGAAGIGKTTLAKVMCNDREVRQRFADGVHWLPFGRERSGEEVLASLASALGLPATDDVDACISARFSHRRVLLVLDDVWSSEQIEPFVKLSPPDGDGELVKLMTTRSAVLAASYGESTRLEHLSDEASLRMLRSFSGYGKAALPADGDDTAVLLRACRGNAAMLRSVAALCRKRGIENAASYLIECRSRQLAASLPDASEYGTLYAAIEGALAQLSTESARRAAMLAIFPEDTEMPLAVVAQLWGDGGNHMDGREVQAELEALEAWQLVDVDWRARRVALIDLNRDYLRCRGKNELAAWHAGLLCRCGRRAIGTQAGDETDAYWADGRRWVYHLCEGGALAVDGVKLVDDLRLSAIALVPSDGSAIAKLVASCASLTSVDVGFNNLDEPVATAIVRGLRQHDTTTSLGLGSCKVSTRGAKAIAEYVERSRVLTSLNLEFNHIDPEGAISIAHALSKSPPLAHLNLSEMNRSIDDRDDTTGVVAIADALKSNSKLTSLNLSGNAIDVTAAAALANALALNTKLQHLDLSSNRICGIWWHAVQQMGTYDATAIRALAKALRKNAVLKGLNLRGNDLGEPEKHLLRSALTGSGLVM